MTLPTSISAALAALKAKVAGLVAKLSAATAFYVGVAVGFVLGLLL